MNSCSVAQIRMSEVIWTCMYVRSKFIYVMIRQVQSIYWYGQVFWTNEFNIIFLLTQKNKYICFTSAHEKKIKILKEK